MNKDILTYLLINTFNQIMQICCLITGCKPKVCPFPFKPQLVYRPTYPLCSPVIVVVAVVDSPGHISVMMGHNAALPELQVIYEQN